MTIMSKNAKDYGLDTVEPDRQVEFDTIELQTPTHLALVADAVERPISELKELNPALLRSVAPAGYALHVPKGTLASLETAFTVVPPNRRDSWRLHRVQAGDTFAALGNDTVPRRHRSASQITPRFRVKATGWRSRHPIPAIAWSRLKRL